MSTFDKPIVRKPATVLTDAPTGDDKLPEQLICPNPAKVTANDLVPVTAVTSVAGLTNLPSKGVLAFDHKSPLLGMFIAYAKTVFMVEPVVLLGVPDAVYDSEWEQATWNQTHLAYDELVAEIVAFERADSALKDQAGARQRPEKRQQTIDKPRRTHFDGMNAFDATGKSLPMNPTVGDDDVDSDTGA